MYGVISEVVNIQRRSQEDRETARKRAIWEEYRDLYIESAPLGQSFKDWLKVNFDIEL